MKRSGRHERLAKKYRSTTHYVLSGLVPFTEANVKLSFHPNAFFDDLERLDECKREAGTLRMSYYRSIKRGLIRIDDSGAPRLTGKGLRQLHRYEPRKLNKGAGVLVIFDIPEDQRHLRRHLRQLLRELRFTQVQKSVWRSEYDVIDYLVEGVEVEKLQPYVEIHESVRIK